MRWIPIVFLAVLTLIGCGGSSGSSTADHPFPTLGISWGARNRAIEGLSSALSATITLEPKTGTPLTWTVNRPDGNDQILQEVTAPNRMAPQVVAVIANFFSEANGGGDLVGQAAMFAEIQPNGFMNVSIVTQSRIVRTEVMPGQKLQSGESRTLLFSAFSQEGNLVAVTPNSAFWAVVGGDPVLSFDGKTATASGMGVALVGVTVDRVTSPSEAVSVEPVPAIEILPVIPGSPANSAMFANDMTDDGNFIVGACNGLPFRWSLANGTESLGTVPGFSGNGEAYGVSADGKTVCGILLEDSALTEGGDTHAFVWTEAGGMVLLDMPEGAVQSAALAISDDGTKIVGYALNAQGESLSCLWEIGRAVNTFFPGQASSISGDGLVIGGQFTEPTVVGYLYFGPGLFLRMDGQTPEGSMTMVRALSRDGRVAGGRMANADLAPGFYTPQTGIVTILGSIITSVLSVSADGQMMGGGAPEPGISFIFDNAHGLRNFGMTLVAFDNALGTNLIGMLGGRAPGMVTGISENRMIISGTAFPSGGGAGTVRAFRYTGPDLSKLNLR